MDYQNVVVKDHLDLRRICEHHQSYQEHSDVRSDHFDGRDMADAQLATPPEVARFMRTTTARLANDRYRRRGIPFVKNGASVLYRWDDVHAWIERNTLRPNVERSGAA